MSNAVKYAPGTLIQIELKISGNDFEFRIQDHGKGIPEEKNDAIFGLFERGSSTNYVTGLGIGLFISRSIVEGHNGSIQVESIPGEGATFIIRVPLEQ
jgi:signal transduction histidine kinase